MWWDVCDNSNKVSDDDCLLDLKCKIKDVELSSFRWYKKKYNCFENLTKDEYTAFLSVKSDNNIITQEADKGNAVANDRSDLVCFWNGKIALTYK